MITQSKTETSPKLSIFWRRIPTFLGKEIEPRVGSTQPVIIFSKVDFPAPLGPVSP